jgi:hypothetical protein
MLLVYAVQILTSVRAKRNTKPAVSAWKGAFSASQHEHWAISGLNHESAAPAAESSIHMAAFRAARAPSTDVPFNNHFRGQIVVCEMIYRIFDLPDSQT